MNEYKFIVTLACQLLNACPSCNGNALFVMGLSTKWVCVDCGFKMVVEMPEDPRLQVFKEALDKLG
jgi:uncharacterized protein (DUF983 family)